jgi:biotin carboxylase
MTILCIATYLKGQAFIEECHRLGSRVVLLTIEALADAAWPRDAVAEIHTIRRDSTDDQIRRTVAGIARRHRIERLAALDDFDVEMAGMLREFLQVPGFGRTVSARFRDKLTMRTTARRLGLRVPEFTAAFNDDEINGWADRVPAPWVLKPRSAAASIGVKKIADRDALWSALDGVTRAGDDRAQCLLEAFVSGDVFHVDAIVRHGRLVAAVASKYRTPPMRIAHDGGVFVTRRLPDDSADAKALLEANRALLQGFELRNGVSHSEFIGGPDGPVFLETSARVGGAFIVDVIETATGVNLWQEWARVEIAGEDGAYDPPAVRADIAGIALCLSSQEQPDLSPYDDPEIVTKIRKPHHAGLIVRATSAARVDALLGEYEQRFTRDFLARLPAPERPVE